METDHVDRQSRSTDNQTDEDSHRQTGRDRPRKHSPEPQTTRLTGTQTNRLMETDHVDRQSRATDNQTNRETRQTGRDRPRRQTVQSHRQPD